MFCAYSTVGSVKAGALLPSVLKETRRSDKPGLKLTHEWQPFSFWVFGNKAFSQTIIPLRAHRHYFLQLTLNEYRRHICKWQTIWDSSEIIITSCRKRPKSSRLHFFYGTRTVRTQGDNIVPQSIPRTMWKTVSLVLLLPRGPYSCTYPPHSFLPVI